MTAQQIHAIMPPDAVPDGLKFQAPHWWLHRKVRCDTEDAGVRIEPADAERLCIAELEDRLERMCDDLRISKVDDACYSVALFVDELLMKGASGDSKLKALANAYAAVKEPEGPAD